jgi:hypothetical protein
LHPDPASVKSKKRMKIFKIDFSLSGKKKLFMGYLVIDYLTTKTVPSFVMFYQQGTGTMKPNGPAV